MVVAKTFILPDDMTPEDEERIRKAAYAERNKIIAEKVEAAALEAIEE